jgi:biotin carboxyl carrier protein
MKRFKFTIRGHDYDVEVTSLEGHVARVEVNGTRYKVEIHTEKKRSKTPKLIRKEVPRAKDSHVIKKDTSLYQVKAPLPGIIMQLKVNVGEEVKRGDTLLVYEAMKMENNLASEREGVVKSIKVNAGDSILQGDVLLEIE